MGCGAIDGAVAHTRREEMIRNGQEDDCTHLVSMVEYLNNPFALSVNKGLEKEPTRVMIRSNIPLTPLPIRLCFNNALLSNKVKV